MTVAGYATNLKIDSIAWQPRSSYIQSQNTLQIIPITCHMLQFGGSIQSLLWTIGLNLKYTPPRWTYEFKADKTRATMKLYTHGIPLIRTI